MSNIDWPLVAAALAMAVILLLILLLISAREEIIRLNKYISSIANSDKTKRCSIPPKGWYCTRRPGHDGPCAAVKIQESNFI